MKNSKLYYTLPTIKAVRRRLRRACQPLSKEMMAERSSFVLRNECGEDILKVRRWRNRLMTSYMQKMLSRMKYIRKFNNKHGI